MPTTRATLIQRVRDGDDRLAWQEFYELYSWLIYHYLRARGLNDTDANELVGECMMILSSRMRDFDYDPDRCRFRNYLRNIVHKEIAAMWRKKRPTQDDGEAVAGVRSADPAAEELWDRQWEINHMLHCWTKVQEHIAPKHAEAFKLYVIEERPVEEVARKLGLSANQIYQIKNRTTERLRRAMARLLGREFLNEGNDSESNSDFTHETGV